MAFQSSSGSSAKPAPTLHDLKLCLKAILIASSQRGMNERELQGDYHLFKTKEIPYREHGFSSLQKLIQETMSDAISIRRISGEVRYFSVSDSSTKHIERLVLEQRAKPKSRRGRGGAMGSRGWAPVSRAPWDGLPPPVRLPTAETGLIRKTKVRIVEVLKVRI